MVASMHASGVACIRTANVKAHERARRASPRVIGARSRVASSRPRNYEGDVKGPREVEKMRAGEFDQERPEKEIILGSAAAMSNGSDASKKVPSTCRSSGSPILLTRERQEATNPIRASNRGTVRFSEHPDYCRRRRRGRGRGEGEKEERGCALRGYNYTYRSIALI